MKSAWAWQPSRLVSAASEEKAIGAHGPVRTGGESVDDGHGLLLGGDEGDRDGGKVQVDDGHGLFARKRRRCPDREYLYGIYASAVCVQDPWNFLTSKENFFWPARRKSPSDREYVEMGMREERKCILWSAREVGLI